MKIKNLIAISVVLFAINSANAQAKKYIIHTVAFYNFENLFDTINGPNNDEEWLPNGIQNWTGKKYKQKLENLSRVLSEIGTGENPNSPTFIGGAEIENRGVLEDLIKQPKLINLDYGIVHFDSPDKRGIDVALLYQKKHFKPTSYVNIPLIIYKKQEAKVTKKEKDEETDDKVVAENASERVYTRDQLLVTGFLDGDEVNIIVNHWPSRSGGEKKSSPFREAAGALNRKIIDSLVKINPNAKIITMGDLNDGSYNRSVKVALGAKLKKEELKTAGDIYNPFEQMAKDGNATLFYRDAGDIFDQIMVSEEFVKKDYSSFRYWKAGIWNKPYMIQTTGQYKGYPLRHSMNEIGFSDHFPAYIYLIKEIK
ncbi:endonuclease/exonuclease/phosphatase family protein [Flavobacterium sp. SUN052]|uniref:endonuclease/exonuclease/phosphatase family protein n=1 Tax=Flavobacterium sp. SUN052 TaxID=3002441 RepID=UPI00237DAE2D|nr:endonuclease/exonuclease/phosphatase family protein [Flavobacterium sp. SUN052]MEC4004315.1 endonuclease/exonuclease/phosphatase family protein [Flavobacterium sp. SUN052]